jgi:hypothetical protein
MTTPDAATTAHQNGASSLHDHPPARIWAVVGEWFKAWNLLVVVGIAKPDPQVDEALHAW